MLGKLYNVAAVLAIAHLLALLALAGMLYQSGRLTPERIDAIARILRGESSEEVENQANGSDGTEGKDDAKGEPALVRGMSEEEIRQQQQEDRLRRALSERAYRDRIAQRRLLDQALQNLITTQEQFEKQQKVARRELEQRRGEASDAGFEKEKSLVKKLSPKRAKAHILMKWKESPADAVRLLNALPEGTSTEILEQMKSPEEMKIMHELLERLAKEKVDQFEPGSGKTTGN